VHASFLTPHPNKKDAFAEFLDETCTGEAEKQPKPPSGKELCRTQFFFKMMKTWIAENCLFLPANDVFGVKK
jgi:hypothetical protein